MFLKCSDLDQKIVIFLINFKRKRFSFQTSKILDFWRSSDLDQKTVIFLIKFKRKRFTFQNALRSLLRCALGRAPLAAPLRSRKRSAHCVACFVVAILFVPGFRA